MSRLFNFLKRLTGKEVITKKLVGTDLLGNKYFEETIKNSSKTRRWVAHGADPQEPRDVSSEWDAWLRRRRDNPPSIEELERNVNRMKSVQENVSKLEQKHADPDNVTAQPERSPEMVKFPEYREMEIMPGSNDENIKIK